MFGQGHPKPIKARGGGAELWLARKGKARKGTYEVEVPVLRVYKHHVDLR